MASVEVQKSSELGKESLLDIDSNASGEKSHTNNVASTSQQCALPTRFEAEEAQPEVHIGVLKLVILGVCANLTNLTLGFDFQTAAVIFNGVALDLHIAEKDLQWIFNSLTLALGCTTLISGRIADILGRKTVYVSGIAIFGLFSLVQSLVHNPGGFFIARALSGVGAAMIFASTSGFIVENTPPGRKQSLLLPIVNMGLSLGDLVGLVVAGPLVQATKWRAAFWLMAGLTVVPFIGTVFLVKSQPVLSPRKADKRVDWLGIFLLTAGPILLFYPLSQAQSAPKGWGTPYIIAMLVLSFLVITCGVAWQWYLEHKTNFPPVIRTSLFTRRRGRLALVCLVILCGSGATAGFLFLATVYYQVVVGLNPLQFCLRLLPGPIFGVACNIFVGLVLGRIPSHYLLCAGLVAGALANLLFALRKQGASYWTYELFAHLFSYGPYGLASSTGMVYITKVVNKEEVAAANGCFQFISALGGVMGPALATVVYTSVAGVDGNRHGDIPLGVKGRKALLQGLRAANWFWTGLSFSAAILVLVLLRDSEPDEQQRHLDADAPCGV